MRPPLPLAAPAPAPRRPRPCPSPPPPLPLAAPATTRPPAPRPRPPPRLRSNLDTPVRAERTDLLVQLVREAGPASGLYGAKITGGGSGGTVCVVGDAGSSAEASLRRVLAQYEQRTGFAPYVFEGSSVGALAFGTLHVELKQ